MLLSGRLFNHLRSFVYKPVADSEEEKVPESVKVGRMLLGVAKIADDEVVAASLEGCLAVWKIGGDELPAFQFFGH